MDPGCPSSWDPVRNVGSQVKDRGQSILGSDRTRYRPIGVENKKL
jgi:hypothetical protein